MLLVVDRNGPTMARIGVMRALNRHVVREFAQRHALEKAEVEEGPMNADLAQQVVTDVTCQ
jgi:hypothetical protein